MRASHTLFDDVKITRTAFMFNNGAVYIHDRCESSHHSYSQIFNIGPDVDFNYDQNGNLNLSSNIDDTNVTLEQLNQISAFATFNGTTDPIMGWQSTTFNEVSPINAISYYIDGKDIEFNTVINLENTITSVDYTVLEDTISYTIEFENSSQIIIEI